MLRKSNKTNNFWEMNAKKKESNCNKEANYNSQD